MKDSRILVCLLALGFFASMTTQAEAQLFRRWANPCWQQHHCAPAVNNCCRPRVRWQPRQSCCQMNVYQSAPAISNGCGCGATGQMMMPGTVMTPHIGIGGQVDDNGPIIFGGPTKESCQATYETCMQQCNDHCANNLDACRKHCKCNRDICDPTIKATCNDPRAPCQPVQPNPNPMRNGR